MENNNILEDNYISINDKLPIKNKNVNVIMDNGEKTVGYYYDNYYRSGWMTKTDSGLYSNQIWSGIRVIGWKE